VPGGCHERRRTAQLRPGILSELAGVSGGQAGRGNVRCLAASGPDAAEGSLAVQLVAAEETAEVRHIIRPQLRPSCGGRPGDLPRRRRRRRYRRAGMFASTSY